MPQNATVSIPGATWTQITNSDVSALRVQVFGEVAVHLMATAGAAAPASLAGSLRIPGGGIVAADLTLAQLFPGVSGANRVYAWCQTPASLSVSHA